MKSLTLNPSVKSSLKYTPCPECNGKQHQLILHGNITVAIIKCPACKGTGKFITEKNPVNVTG